LEELDNQLVKIRLMQAEPLVEQVLAVPDLVG
jgi:hypothetical protein